MFKSQVSCWSEGHARIFESRHGAARSDQSQSEAPLDSDFWQNFSEFRVILQWVLPNLCRILEKKLPSGSSGGVPVVKYKVTMVSVL